MLNKSYTITDFNEMPINWAMVDTLEIRHYPWYKEGLKQPTYVKLAISNESLFIDVKAIDIHSSASHTCDNTSVYKDSCFEFFVTPKDSRTEGYINFEINCIGSIYLAFNRNGKSFEATKEQLARVDIKTSLDKKIVKKPKADDQYWTIKIEIPLNLIKQLFLGDFSTNKWCGNFYRCGGIDNQYATWNPVDGTWPDFHQTKCFGDLYIQEVL